MWDERKHPRDNKGRFTDGTSLAQEYKPNSEIEYLKNKSINELKAISIKGSGRKDTDFKESTVELIGKVDFHDEKQVLATLDSYEKELVNLPYEVNISITTDGSVWKVSGTNASVDPTTIPHSLKGSYSYHNHPKDVTWYSFSADDVAFFIENEEHYSKASDDKYEYVMIGTKKTNNINGMNLQYEFDKAYFYSLEKSMNDSNFNIDIDGNHEAVKILSEKFCFKYERNRK